MSTLTDNTDIFVMTEQIVQNANQTSSDSSSTENQGSGGSVITAILILPVFLGIAFMVMNMISGSISAKANEISEFLGEYDGNKYSNSVVEDNTQTSSREPVAPKPVEDKFGKM